ncbi:bifunctional lysylphosphatidylglycerol flippase/synthetase MprF [Amaricoccus sp.]|uniref:bifunctional lysylphosphatidylglycerol flippase/synthetase MprF n=1 Tax=Amaricoccus sp. TaxID=1872485 RepID=UPI001B422486|nr:bifunctional lysylphosphatidylglycerol flippase/synthetase MprF [Amaricoccus sp.]MBP7003385.1 bifunctional lysylphosphatidylglycerol flippase/synthetase MprF [Amaricoccus sp.]
MTPLGSAGTKAETAADRRPGALARLAAWTSRRRALLATVLTLAMLVVAVAALARLARHANYDEVVAALLATPPWRVGLAVLLTAASFAVLTLYDLNAFRALGQKQAWRRIAPGAAAAYAVAQTTGFGPLSGAAVRLRFYTPLGVSPGDIARVVALVTAGFGLGLVATAALAALATVPAAARFSGLPEGLVRAAALLAVAACAGLVAAGGGRLPLPGGRSLELPARGALAAQIAITAADLATAAGVLWAFLPPGSVDYLAFLPLFGIALALGILSHVPAGLGVFEAVLMAALAGAAPPAHLLAAFALYRLVYQALPLLVAALGLAAAEARRLASPAGAVLRAAGGLAPQALAALTLVLGAMLVFSAVTPARAIDLEWLGAIFPLPLIESAHFLASVLGALMMVAARGLAFRLDGAWWTALLAALAALALSLVKAVAIFEAAALAALVLALLLGRDAFDRRAALLEAKLTLPWIGAVAAVLVFALAILRFAFGHAEFGAESWLRFELSAEAPRGLRALVGSALLVGLAAAWSLLRPAPMRDHAPAPEELARAAAIARTQPDPGAGLVRMGDKRVMFSDDGRGFVMYARQGASWIALFDPVGPVELWPELIWRFVETARGAGGRAAFYEATPENLALYADAGLRFFKLGEEARVDLAAFDLKGGARSGQRNVLSRGAREGLSVEILAPGAVPPLMARLRAISDAWLAERGAAEKGFSLGAFEPAFVAGGRVAVMRRGDEIVAFATLLATDLGEEVAVDLMRHVADVPNVAMEFLFIRLCEILKAEGALWFSLGMAPLAGLSSSAAAPNWQRVGAAIFEQGVPSYNFKGLRSFKEKLKPAWRPRYLAVSGGAGPALVLLDATRLISRGGKDER